MGNRSGKFLSELYIGWSNLTLPQRKVFLDYGNQIKERSRAVQTFLVQLACGAEGYLPTEKAEKGGHYSAFV